MKSRSVLRLVLKLGLIMTLGLVAPILIIVGMPAILRPSVAATLGVDIAKSGFFYFAMATLSLIVYLILIVAVMRFWEEFLKAFLLKSFKYVHKDTGRA
jgi:hypothetical protein